MDLPMTQPLRIYRLEIKDTETLIVERPEWGPRGLVGRVSIEEVKPTDHGYTHREEYFLGSISLTSPQDRLTLFNLLSQMWGLKNEDTVYEPAGDGSEPDGPEPPPEPVTKQSVLWQVGKFFADIIEAENNRNIVVNLADIRPQPQEKLTIDLGGMTILTNHPTTLFGDGESCKSIIALNLVGEMALRGLRPLMLDYELGAQDHVNRLSRMFREMPRVAYMRCTSPLVEMVSKIREVVEDYDINYLLVDSVAAACGSEAERSESANAYYSALLDIGVPGHMSIAHRSKASYDKPGEEKPFGSSFWHNWARETYLVTQDKDQNGSKYRRVTLACRKANLRNWPPMVEVNIRFEPSRYDLVWKKAASAQVQEALDSSQEKALQALKDLGPLTYDAWLAVSQMPSGEFSGAMQALRTRGAVVRDPEDDGQWMAR
jgi:hypothetical protein